MFTSSSVPAKDQDKADWEAKKTARDTARASHETAQKELCTAREQFDAVKLNDLSTESRKAQNTLFQTASSETGLVATTIKSNEDTIKEYKTLRQTLLQSSGGGASAAIQQISTDMGIAAPLPDPANTATKNPDEDFFTPISVEISASSDTKSTKESASSMSYGASASYGAFWSASASVSHSQSDSHAEAVSELVSSSVKVSFECMRVDITRPWLRAELFYDEDLVVGPNGPQ